MSALRLNHEPHQVSISAGMSLSNIRNWVKRTFGYAPNCGRSRDAGDLPQAVIRRVWFAPRSADGRLIIGPEVEPTQSQPSSACV
jgi:hypothetical protein